MPKITTFVDANVLLAAWPGKEDLLIKAMEIIDDPNREFIISDYLELELIPKPTFFKNYDEIEFMRTFLDNAYLKVDSSPLITSRALNLACKYGLSAIDALHAEVSIQAKADVFITNERHSKALHRLTEIKVESI